MRSVKVAKLKKSLSTYLNLVKLGEEIVIYEGKTPIAKLICHCTQKERLKMNLRSWQQENCDYPRRLFRLKSF
jgi:antitoxin (DNA-binding transcriptional repressor) of toxin-antitoxin stability system